MKIERIKNAKKNIVFGLILKLYKIIVPFFMRTAMIYFLGVEYLGLNSLFTSILQVLNLAELGVGSAMVFSMYKPIANDDEESICALMKMYKIYYRIIGSVILVIGLIICPFIPYLIKSDLPPDINIYILYVINLAATVLSYWLFAYKNCLLEAYQRNDITSKITLCVNTIQYILQFLMLFIFKNYYTYIIISLLAQIAINITTAIIVDRIYPKYKAMGNLDKKMMKDINQRVRDLFTSKVGYVIVNSADSIVISAFLGLRTLAIYQNYYFILTAIIGFVGVVFTSCSAGIGNSLIVENNEKNFNDLNKFTFIIFWVTTFCTASLLCLYQLFMELWVGKENLLEISAVICFCCYYYIYEFNLLLNTYKDSAGIWHKDRFRPLIVAVANLILNLLLVNSTGVYGVLLSTVLSTLLIGVPWLIHNLFTEVFKRKPKEYVISLLRYTISAFIIIIITYGACQIIQGKSVVSLILKGIICCIIPNTCIYIIYRKSKEMKDTKYILKNVIKR